MFDDMNDERKENTGGASFIYGTVAELRALLSEEWSDIDTRLSEDELGAHLARVRIIRKPDGSEAFKLELLGSESQAQGPALEVSAHTIDFGVVRAGNVKDVALIFKNNGSEPIEITNISKIGAETQAFSFSGIGTPFQMLPGLMVQADLHFMPAKEGQYAAALHIETNAETDSILTITLAGIGLPMGDETEGVDENALVLTLEPNPVKVSEPLYYRYLGADPMQCGIIVYDAFAQELYARYRVEINPGTHPLPVPMEFDGGKYFIKFLLPHTQRILSLVVEGKKKRRRGRPPKKRY